MNIYLYHKVLGLFETNDIYGLNKLSKPYSIDDEYVMLMSIKDVSYFLKSDLYIKRAQQRNE